MANCAKQPYACHAVALWAIEKACEWLLWAAVAVGQPCGNWQQQQRLRRRLSACGHSWRWL